ncbi:UNVERIFIED_CONTAM: component of the polarisome [Siphonaria sp. JEL0065]|nr:component of the polarisome [Siphonaria sp. JEL0065]
MSSAGDQYLTLRTFLGQDFLSSPDAQDANSEASQIRMGRLNQQQFNVFTIDLIDEILRRKEGPGAPPHLPARQDFHPKRNQTRQKLASLAILNFKKMGCDVYFELERRHPNLLQEYPAQQPRTATAAAATPAPNTQTLANATPPKPPTTTPALKQQSSSNGKSIDEVMSELGKINLVAPTPRTPVTTAAGDATSGVLRDAMERMRKDNAAKMEALTTRINTLETELDTTKRALEAARKEAHENGEDYMSARKEVEGLQFELAESRKETQEVRKELSTVRKDSSEAVATVAAVRTEMSLLRQENQNSVQELSTTRKELNETKRMYLDSQTEANNLRAETEKARQEVINIKQANQRQMSDYVALKTDYADIKSHIADQQVLFGEVRIETTSLLAEVKSLSAKNNDLRNQNETLASKKDEGIKMADELAQQYDELVRNFEALKIENDGLREQVQLLSGKKAVVTYGADGAAVVTELEELPEMTPLVHEGVLEMTAAQTYHNVTEKLLRAVRTDPSTVLPSLKAVIAACKQATENIEDYETTHYKNHEVSTFESQLDDARAHFSKALTGLIAATKAHISKSKDGAKGDASAVDKAVSILTESINLVARLVKTKCKNPELEEYGGEDEETYQRIQQLKEYVEGQTATIVEGIQSLLGTMRSGGSGTAFLREMNGKVQGISGIVKGMLKASHEVFSKLNEEDEFRVECESVLTAMASARKKLEAKAGELGRDPQNSDVKQAIGASAYDVAKLVKKFVALLDEV